MHYKNLCGGFLLFGIGGIINYISTSTISSLLLGLVFIAISAFFLTRYRDFKRNERNETNETNETENDVKK